MDRRSHHKEFVASREGRYSAAIQRRLATIKEYEEYLRPDLSAGAREFLLHTLACERHLLSLELAIRDDLNLMKAELAKG